MVLTPDFWLWLVALGLIAVGIAGTILPALPGVPLVFAGMLLAAWIDDFARVGYLTLIVLGILTLLGVVVDFVASIAGAKRVGASRAALVGATVGTIVGIFFGLLGLILGPFVGALVGELSARKGMMAAGRIALGTWLGMLLAVVIKLSLVFTMLGVFIFAYYVSGDRLPLI